MMLLTVGSIAVAAMLVAVVFPAIARTGNAIASDRAGIALQANDGIAVVNAYSELDGSAVWQDTDSDTYFDVWIWVKNTGGVTIHDLDDLDVFVHGRGDSERIPHTSAAGAAYPPDGPTPSRAPAPG
jgi:archaellum component FlaG (FlaF/FlaG flagellin family)